MANSPSKPLVMVIDDDDPTRMMASEFLSQSGFRVVEFSSGSQALDQLTELKPNLIVLDVEMPDRDGFSVCQEIRSLSEFKSIPILMLTGLNNGDSIELAFNAGATDFATKPINWSLLSYRLRYMYRAWQSADELERSQERVLQLAYYDNVTALPNSALLSEELSKAVQSANVNQSEVAVLDITVHDFNFVNDTLGHECGDVMLNEIAKRVVLCVGDEAFTAHTGPGSFSVVLSKPKFDDEPTQIANNIIEALSRPYEFINGEVPSASNVGIAVFPEHADSSEALLKNAAVAVFDAKNSGKNVSQVHNASMLEAAQTRFRLQSQMRTGLTNNEFQVWYQPQIDLHTGNLYSVEALLRWIHPELGFVSPADFIPIAEDNGFIVPLGEWVLRQSCEQAKRWNEQGFPVQQVAVNISVLQFIRADFIDTVEAVLNDTGLPPHQLELEITESLLASDTERAVTTLRGRSMILVPATPA